MTTLVERIRKGLEDRAGRILKEVFGQEGMVEEYRIGLARRLSWNNGQTVEICDYNGKVYGKYRIAVSLHLIPVLPTPKTSSIPVDSVLESRRTRR